MNKYITRCWQLITNEGNDALIEPQKALCNLPTKRYCRDCEYYVCSVHHANNHFIHRVELTP